MGPKKTRDESGAATDSHIKSSILEAFGDIPQEKLESTLIQALAIGITSLRRGIGCSIAPSRKRCDYPALGFGETIEKGLEYEREIVKTLQDWSRANRGRVEHVGPDNRPGDIVVELSAGGPGNQGLRVVVEVRNRQKRMGRKAVVMVLAEAMLARSADAAIYLSRTSDGLGQELGDWAEGECTAGPYVACTHEHLITALRYLYARKNIARQGQLSPGIDEAAIQAQIVRVRMALDGIRKMSRLGNEIRSATWEMDDESDRLRQEIRDALRVIEDALRPQINDKSEVQRT